MPDLDTIVVPVGGGGLISGIAVAAKGLQTGDRVVGVQVEGYPGMCTRSASGPSRAGTDDRRRHRGHDRRASLTREIVRALVDDLLVVTEQHIEAAVALAAEIEKTVVEGAGAAGLAALSSTRTLPRRNVVVVLTGGNIDLRVCRRLLRALARSGRLVRLRSRSPTVRACSRRSRS